MHILLIDDSEIDLFLNEKLLEKGCPESTVSKTNDSKEALDMLNTNSAQFDLVICDKQMPKMTGFDLAREVQNQVPVVILTASIMEKDIETAKSIPGLELWEKPLDPNRVKSYFA